MRSVDALIQLGVLTTWRYIREGIEAKKRFHVTRAHTWPSRKPIWQYIRGHIRMKYLLCVRLRGVRAPIDAHHRGPDSSKEAREPTSQEAVDCETTINALAGQCLTDTQRHFSRLDFRIVNCVNAVCIIEVDEFQHFRYNLSCVMMSRVADVRASLVAAGYTLPIYWIRYSPSLWKLPRRIGADQSSEEA